MNRAKKLMLLTRKAKDVASQPANDIAWGGSAESKWNEADAVLGWSGSRSDLTSDLDVAVDAKGTRSLRVTSNSATNGDHQERNFAVVAGRSYQFKFKSKYQQVGGITSTPRIYIDTGNNTGNRIILNLAAITEWTDFDYTLDTAAFTGNIEVRIIASQSSGDVIGNSVWLDELEILVTDN